MQREDRDCMRLETGQKRIQSSRCRMGGSGQEEKRGMGIGVFLLPYRCLLAFLVDVDDAPLLPLVMVVVAGWAMPMIKRTKQRHLGKESATTTGLHRRLLLLPLLLFLRPRCCCYLQFFLSTSLHDAPSPPLRVRQQQQQQLQQQQPSKKQQSHHSRRQALAYLIQLERTKASSHYHQHHLYLYPTDLNLQKIVIQCVGRPPAPPPPPLHLPIAHLDGGVDRYRGTWHDAGKNDVMRQHQQYREFSLEGRCDGAGGMMSSSPTRHHRPSSLYRCYCPRRSHRQWRWWQW